MRKLWILVAALAIVATAQADDAAEKVVKKAVDAHGGEKVLLAMKAADMTTDMTVKLDGMEFKCKADMLYSFPDRYKITIVGEVANQKIKLVQSVNGQKARSTANGEEKEMNAKQEAELKESIRIQEICMIAPLLDPSKFTLKAEKDAKFGKDDAAVVIVKAKEMSDTTLYFDKKTGLLLRMKRMALDPSGDTMVEEVTDFSDYKKVDGIQTPMTMKVLHDGKLYMTGKITQMKYYEKLDDKKFRHDDLKAL